MKLSLVLIFVISICSVQAKTYYVATDGSNSSDGSVGGPFLTLDFALGQVAPGDTVQLAAGSYPDRAQTEIDGTADNMITIRGAGTAQTVIADRLTITHGYYRLTEIRNQGNYLEMTGSGARYNLIEECEFTGAGTQGIYMKWNSGESCDGAGLRGRLSTR